MQIALPINNFGGVSSSSVLRNIASGIRVPGWGASGLTNGTDTTQNVWSCHFNESGKAVTQAAVMYSGFYTDGTSEVDAPNAYTVTSSIEYPVGSGIEAQFTWDSGNVTKSVAIGANPVSDLVSLGFTIPIGAQFCIKTFVSVTAGQKWPTCGSLAGASSFGERGVGLADKTMSGTVTTTTGGLQPSAVLAPSAGAVRVSLAGLGDSIMNGSGDVGFDSHFNTGFMGRAATGNCPFIVASVGGTTAHSSAVAGKFSRRADLFAKAGCTDVWSNYGVNDLASQTAATLEADILIIANQVVAKGMRYGQCTITPQSSSTQNWRNVASQTTGASKAQKVLFNNWLRGNPAPGIISLIFENAWATESAHDSNLWGTNLTPNNDFSQYLGPADSWIVGSTVSTTSFTSNSTRPSFGTSFYLGGSVLFTSGVLSGTYVSISSYTLSGGTFNFSTPLASAPSPGDTFIAYPVTAAPTSDGTHPNVTSFSGSGFGGHIVLMHVILPVLQSLL